MAATGSVYPRDPQSFFCSKLESGSRLQRIAVLGYLDEPDRLAAARYSEQIQFRPDLQPYSCYRESFFVSAPKQPGAELSTRPRASGVGEAAQGPAARGRGDFETPSALAASKLALRPKAKHTCFVCLPQAESGDAERTSEPVAPDANFGLEGHGFPALPAPNLSEGREVPVPARNRDSGARFVRDAGTPLRNDRALAELIGTPERLETRVTCRKQTTATHSNRYTFHPGLTSLPLKHRPSSLQSSPVSGILSTEVPSAPRALGWKKLPELPDRVETRPSHRKQGIGYRSTRDTSRHHFLWPSRQTLPALMQEERSAQGRSFIRAKSWPPTASL